MFVNIMEIPHGIDLLHDPTYGISELKRLKSFVDYSKPDRNRIIRYILLMHEKNSPLRTKIQNVADRKDYALALAGFKDKKKEDRERIDEIKQLLAERVVEMIIEFLQWQGNRLLAMIDSNEQTFYEFQRALMEPVTETDDSKKIAAIEKKSKLMAECDRINNRLEGYYLRLYGDEDIIKVVQKRFTPESMAQ
ncbi:MAG TPA: hypothetical protein ENH82_09535 [bacterium]|nr:hypothetical protein [bacterium]